MPSLVCRLILAYSFFEETIDVASGKNGKITKPMLLIAIVMIGIGAAILTESGRFCPGKLGNRNFS